MTDSAPTAVAKWRQRNLRGNVEDDLRLLQAYGYRPRAPVPAGDLKWSLEMIFRWLEETAAFLYQIQVHNRSSHDSGPKPH